MTAKKSNCLVSIANKNGLSISRVPDQNGISQTCYIQ